jgi:hypothetical protein
MARLRINDGYTLSDETKSEDDKGNELPVVKFAYRPALPDAIYVWQYDTNHAASGTEQLDIDVAFLADHLVSWDVVMIEDGTGKLEVSAPLNASNIRIIPNPILQQLIAKVARWSLPARGRAGKPAASEKETSEGNS